MLLDKYYPGYLVNKEHDEKSMTMTYKEIEGNPITADRLDDCNTLDNNAIVGKHPKYENYKC